jgi:hypothetical protein
MSMFVLAAALAFGTAAPEPAAPAPAPTAPIDQLRTAPIDPSSDMRRVCVVDRSTGPGLGRRYCQTRAEWVAQGTDPLARRR